MRALARLGPLVLVCACVPTTSTTTGPAPANSTTTIAARPASGFHARPWPRDPGDREPDVCFDLGAWFGFAPPDDAHLGSFAGPYDLRRPGWVAARGLSLELEGFAVVPAASSVEREVGLLRQHLVYASSTQPATRVEVELELWFDDAEQITIRARLQSAAPLEVQPAWSGELFAGTTFVSDNAVLRLAATEGRRATPLALRFGPEARLELDPEGSAYRATLPSLELAASRPTQLLVRVGGRTVEVDPDTSHAAGRERWHTYLDAASLGVAPEDQALAYKAVETLISNWRQPDADIVHAGLFPAWAYDGFHGFWAWDSWKHAVALARFEPELAREQIRLMLALAREDGMVPDVVYPGSEEDNWRDTKPPLAAWAVEAVYRETKDLEFVAEMMPALTRYHLWWYTDRDHDDDGLCEYGSTDGTRIAAAWESGMDNAVRFDEAEMVENHAGAFSMNIESVDLNAYLYAEKLSLARMLEALGQSEAADVHTAEAELLAERLRTEHWDDALGWFRDRHLDGRFAAGMGPEGWIPLWTGVASPEQAARVRDSMLDPKRFGTTMPLGTLAADDPGFDPARGYWRGPVWLDQAYFALAGLRRYGFTAEADQLTAKLLDSAEGLRTGGAIRENYHPLTGAGQNARHFSWSAAAVLMLLWLS